MQLPFFFRPTTNLRAKPAQRSKEEARTKEHRNSAPLNNSSRNSEVKDSGILRLILHVYSKQVTNHQMPPQESSQTTVRSTLLSPPPLSTSPKLSSLLTKSQPLTNALLQRKPLRPAVPQHIPERSTPEAKDRHSARCCQTATARVLFLRRSAE